MLVHPGARSPIPESGGLTHEYANGTVGRSVVVDVLQFASDKQQDPERRAR
jgi:hypothetical protein